MSEKTTSAEELEATQETEPEKKTIAAARTTKSKKSPARKAAKRKTSCFPSARAHGDAVVAANETRQKIKIFVAHIFCLRESARTV